MSRSPLDMAPATDQFSDRALREASEIIAASYGWMVDFIVSDTQETFSTTYDFSTNRIQVVISRALLNTTEISGVVSPVELLSVAIAHELGHVRDYQAQPPDKNNRPDRKTEYFTNVIDDIAINFGIMNKTTYMQQLFRQTYDTVLTPKDTRATTSEKPKHIQFMSSILALTMLEPASSHGDAYSADQLTADLAKLEILLAPEVEEALATVTTYPHQGETINLLRVLRTHGLDLSQRSLVSTLIRQQFDMLYEEDISTSQPKGSPSEEGQPDTSQEFDYNNHGTCAHTTTDSDVEHTESTSHPINLGDLDQNGNSFEQEQASSEIPESLAHAIAEAIDQVGQSARKEVERIEKEAALQAQNERLRQIQQELNLNDNDFAGYMAARTRHWSDILALADIISRLKRERSDNLLSPSRDVRAQGHRINVTRLAQAAARDQLDGTPQIFKASYIGEKIMYEFDGLDLFLCGDVSDSMRRNNKASESAATAVVLLEGLMLAAQTPHADDLVRIQIQAFGNTDHVIAPLSSRPTAHTLGATYHKLKNPNEMTYITPSLEKIYDTVTQPSSPGTAPRLTIIAIISDGKFQDASEATKIGNKLGDALGENGVILQLVLDKQDINKLHDRAHIINVSTASDLPRELLGRLPELLQAMRNKHA